MKHRNGTTYQFGPFCLDAEERVLLRDGRLVPLPAKAIRTLLVLVQNGGHVVEKDVLMSEVWPDEIVEEGNLAQQVFLLRKALGEMDGVAKYIETVPRRGYRFFGLIKQTDGNMKIVTAPIQTSDLSIKAINRSQSYLLAVLPFICTDRDEAVSHLANRLTQSLTTELPQLPRVRVVDSETVAAYWQDMADPWRIGRQLGVNAVLVGRIRIWEMKVNVTATLIDVLTGSQRWSGTFSNDNYDVSDIQQRILIEISVALQLGFIPIQEETINNRRPENAAAYENYLKGVFYCRKRSEEGLKKSVTYFTESLAHDPQHAHAHAGLATSYNLLGIYSILDPGVAFVKAKASAERAVAIDDNLAEAHVSLGLVKLLYDWDCQAAEECAKHAIHLNPNCVMAYLLYGFHLVAAGRFQDAISAYRRALQIDPFSLIANADLGYCFYFARRYEEAIKQYQYVMELDDQFEMAHLWLGWAFVGAGKLDDAIRQYQRALAFSGRRVETIAAMATVLALSETKDESLDVLADLNAVAKRKYVSPYMIACIYAALGESDKAIDALERALAHRSHLLINVRVDPRLDSLRSDPRFADLIARVIPAKCLRPNSEAFEHYREGRACWSDHSREGLEKAAMFFQRAIELDPNYVDAYSALVDCYLRLVTNYFLPSSVRLNPSISAPSGQGHRIETQALVEFKDRWDSATAERENRRAVELNCPYTAPYQWHAAYKFSQKLYQDSLTTVNKQRNASPPDLQTLGSDLKLRAYFDVMNLLPADEIQILCVLSRGQIETGNIEAARLLLSRWYQVGEWPQLNGLTPQFSADLLLTAGCLAGRLASVRQVPHGQKHSQALLHGAITLFEQLGLTSLAAEGRSELGRSYDREGLFDLARTNYLVALNELTPDEWELKGRTLLRFAFSEMKVGRLRDSLGLLNDASQVVESAAPSTLHFYHIAMGTTLGELAIAENSDAHFYEACAHYEKALFRSGAVGHHRRTAVVANNHGYLLLEFRKLKETESALMRARSLFDHFGERCPQLDEILARFHLEMHELDLAEVAIGRSVKALDACGEDAVLSESLRTQGRVFCKLGRYREARRVLDRAYELADRCGDSEGAGLALMIMAEEMFDELRIDEPRDIATRLNCLLGQSQRADVVRRLRNCLGQIAATCPVERKSQTINA
jgi:DNA-binding winged helix-turn-helix (wHTH) protein/tetratricopeptide (TPR) repeat protein